LELIKIKAQVEDERSEVRFAAQVPGPKKILLTLLRAVHSSSWF